MNRDEYRTFLLNNLYGAHAESGGDEVVCKCKYCADKMDHYHMSISIPRSEAEPSLFNCWICHSSGIVTANRLIEWGIYDTEWCVEVTKHNAAVMKVNPSSYHKFGNAIYNTFIINLENDSNKAKLDYINDRLGTSLTIQECADNNIVLNLIDVLNYNRISEYTRDPRVVKALSDNFVGFMSYDRNFINLRRIIPKGNLYEGIDRKYMNYNIHGKEDNTMKFIMLPTFIDISKKIEVHVAEGAFDILSVKYNLRQIVKPDMIYGAVTGNAYKGFVKYLITNIGIINMDLHLYLDNDNAGLYTLQDLLYELQPFPLINVYAHYNTLEKDMGVKIEQINEVIEQVK